MDRSGYKCVYCGKEKCVLQLARVRPKSKGGSDRTSNLVGPHVKCNEKKADRLTEEFLSKKPHGPYQSLGTD
jgi:5-methylcytosine-specific restriction endonuclease McrA